MTISPTGSVSLLIKVLSAQGPQQAPSDSLSPQTASVAADSVTIVESIARIWQDDRIAVYVTFVMVVVQFAIFAYTISLTGWPLAKRGRQIAEIKPKDLRNQTAHRLVAASSRQTPDELSYALDRIRVRISRPGDGEPIDVDHVLDPSRLLPTTYNARLDNAAPGLFTALGIFGTFVGLILAFLRVDPNLGEATNSISPLIGGMVVAFVNSLLGVLLSMIWSYRSRRTRHQFDVACHDLALSIRTEFDISSPEASTIHALYAIERSVDAQGSGLQNIERALSHYADETRDSSHRMLEELVPRLEEAFKSITAMPFEKLDSIVSTFDAAVERASEKQLEVGTRLGHVAEELRSAEEVLVRAVDRAGVTADSFAKAVASVEDSLDSAASIAAESRSTAGAIAQSSEQLRAIVVALTAATEGLSGTSLAIDAQAKALDRAAVALDRAGEAMETGLGETVVKTVEQVRGDLIASTTALVQGYRETTEGLITEIDDRITDLTDRLSAELTVLANRLPAEVQTLNEAANRVRQQIVHAINKLEEATVRFSENTPEKLRAILVEFDHALAEAINHFSGTLATWDGHIGTIADASERLQELMNERAGDRAAQTRPIQQEA